SRQERTMRIVRGLIPIETVRGFQLGRDDQWDYLIDSGSGIGYIFISAIHSSTLHELRQAESKLKAQGARALVIDLRFANGDTPMHQAEMVGDSLVGGGTMWRTDDVDGHTQEYHSSRECLFRDWPLAILINQELTDPMTQALAAALRDNG